MKRKTWKYGAAVLSLLMILGCGGLRYSQVAPEAKDFRPKTIGVLPADLGTYEEARGVVDEVITGDLVRRKWFQDVVAADTISRQLRANEEFRKTVAEYLGKLKMVNFSDPGLSQKIGGIARVDAFLVVNVDYWQYTMENQERLAKVGMGIKMIDAGTGIVMWRASHHESEKYRWVKPELADVAKKLAARMMDEMPH
jgi:hypothetical protein